MKQGWGHIVPGCPYKDWKKSTDKEINGSQSIVCNGTNILHSHRIGNKILRKLRLYAWQCTTSCAIRVLLLIHCAFSVKIGAGSLTWERQEAALHTLSGLYVFLQRGCCAHLQEFLFHWNEFSLELRIRVCKWTIPRCHYGKTPTIQPMISPV